MRIVAGNLRGQPFSAPPGRDTRPTTDRVREAVFSSVFSLYGDLDGVWVLDLYAGSGAMGFESLSRGATRAVGVESARQAQRTIGSNAHKLGVADHYELVCGDAASAPARLAHIVRVASARYGVVFADPPYAVSASTVTAIFSGLASEGALEAGALICYEHGPRELPSWPEAFVPLRTKTYGDTALSYARYAPGSDSQRTAAPELAADPEGERHA